MQNRTSRSAEHVALFSLLRPASVVCPDLFGYGPEAHADADRITIDTQVEYVRATIDSAAPDARVHLVGHSVGGVIAMAFAHRFPERVASVFNVEGNFTLADAFWSSKSGVATLFGSKEQLQLATVETAREAFLKAVVSPTSESPPGTARLRALIERWISYAEQPLFPGGCFWAASLPDFDSRPGPVRDALRRQHKTWLALLAEQVRHAVDSDEMTNVDAMLAAFQIDAILSAANTAFRLGESQVADKVRRTIRSILDCGRN